MNKCGLEGIFGDLAARLPLSPDGSSDGNESFTFTSETLPIAPSQIETQNLYIRKGSHIYHPSFKVDSIGFNTRKETYRYLGLLILSAIFHSQSSKIHVKLNHSKSDISNLIIEYKHFDLVNLYPGYRTKPFYFEYYPALSWKHPFDKCIDPQHLPCFSLTNMEDFQNSDDDWKNRDTVRIFGSDTGMVRFAELLLNAALPQNNSDEYALEGESGFRGVGINSAEVTLLLPGHIFWVDEHWN
ncbi:MAG: hypothetical protein M3388_03040 [Acidobacteriota bacterium]|nr:hypothetical protein [Acidobacteriota bacterium]